jgi:hypothetical protein
MGILRFLPCSKQIDGVDEEVKDAVPKTDGLAKGAENAVMLRNQLAAK